MIMENSFDFNREGRTRVIVKNEHVIITREGFLNWLQFGKIKKQTILLKDIANLEFRPAKPRRGFIRLVTKNGSKKDKNIVYFFGEGEERTALELKGILEKRMN